MRTQRQFDLLRALALLSDTKLEANTNWLFDEIVDFYYSDSPAVASYKPIVKEELEDYWLDPFEVYYYYTSGLLTRYLNNFYDDKYDYRVFKNNMDRATLKFGNTYFQRGIEIVRREAILVQDYVDKYKPSVWDNKTNQEIWYHVEYTWKTNSKKACDICKNNNGKKLTDKNIHSHWNCRCRVIRHEWYETKNGEKLYETTKIL